MVNVPELKQKIIKTLEERGPSLPVHVSKSAGIDQVLASAILSELIGEKKVRLSTLLIGSSHLYLLPGQEEKLENFSDNLKSVEKEAFAKLKASKLLDDDLQEPKIRVALRSIKDFAVPVQVSGKLYWKYFTLPNDKLKQSLEEAEEVAIGEKVIGQKVWEDIKKEYPEQVTVIPSVQEKMQAVTTEIAKQIQPALEQTKQEVEKLEQSITRRTVPILEQAEEILSEEKQLEKTKEHKEKPAKPIKPGKDKFLNEIKPILGSRNIEIISIESFDKKQVILKVRNHSAPETVYLLFALDKKKPAEQDIKKAYKKSLQYKLPFSILTRAEPTKKLKDSIDAHKTMLKLESF